MPRDYSIWWICHTMFADFCICSDMPACASICQHALAYAHVLDSGRGDWLGRGAKIFCTLVRYTVSLSCVDMLMKSSSSRPIACPLPRSCCLSIASRLLSARRSCSSRLLSARRSCNSSSCFTRPVIPSHSTLAVRSYEGRLPPRYAYTCGTCVS